MKKILLIVMMAAVLSACAQAGQSEKETETVETAEPAREEKTAGLPETDADQVSVTEGAEKASENAGEASGEAAESDRDPVAAKDSVADKQSESATEPASEPAPENGAVPASVTPDLAAVRSDMISRLGITEYLDVEADRLMDLYGIDAADLVQAGCFVSMSGVFPHEVVMVETVDAAAASRVAGLLQNRLNEVRNQSATYDAENYALAQSCTVDTDGLVVSMFLSPEHEDMRKILLSCLQ